MAVLAVAGPTVLFACGATSVPTVASVQRSPISRSALGHWTAIKRAELQNQAKPVIPAVAVERTALAFLITAEWLEKEAAAQGISVSPSEVNATYQQLLSGPTGQTFAESLKRRGLSSEDELRVLRLGALAQKLRAKIAAGYHGASAAQIAGHVSAFIAAYQQRWRQRTTCRPSYIIAECGNGRSP